ncbi:hypothetical protein ACVW17_003941 [Bradyrhizobium sp. USDA 4473]
MDNRQKEKHRASLPGACLENAVDETYFSEPLIELKVPLSDEPTPFTAAMMAIAMPVAISPYSMAVAPDSSCKNLTKKALIAALPLSCDAWNRRFLFRGQYYYGEI